MNKTKNQFSLQIQCLDNEVDYASALYKPDIKDKEEATKTAEQKLIAFKNALFGNKKCKCTLVDEITTKKYNVDC